MRVHSIVLTLLALFAPFAQAKTFSLPGGDVDAAALLGPWFNHDECYFTQETSNNSALFEQPSEFVPDGAIFLTISECGSLERVGTVPVGTKLVVIPLFGSYQIDADDDINSNNTEECPGRGTPLFEESVDEELSLLRNKTSYSKEPFATVNGDSLEPLFLIWEKEFYFSACPNDPDREICDDCDINFQPPEGCQPLAGTDLYPIYVWAAFDETEWKSGETRKYNFGATLIHNCLEMNYTLTAEEKDTSDTATRMCCMFAKLLFLLLSLWVVL
jgi:hypothetical protein